MSVSDTDQQMEVDANYEAFVKMLPKLLDLHRGKYALLRSGSLIEMFDTTGDALIYAQKRYADGRYSIQQIVDTIADLGFFSHAMRDDELSA